MAKKSVRKPRALFDDEYDSVKIGKNWIHIDVTSAFTPKPARELAAWLVKAADYLDSRKKAGK